MFVRSKEFTARTVDNDIKILSERFDITVQDVRTEKSFVFFIALMKQFLFLLVRIHRYKIIYIWFADYHSFLPVMFSKIFRKICIVNIGGYDADEILINKAETIKEKFRRFCVKYTVKNCNKLLPVSNPTKSNLNKFTPTEKSEVAYCCVDISEFKLDKTIKKENLIITIGGGGMYLKEALRKRLDFFVEIGNLFNIKHPEYNAKFWLIGHDQDTETYKYLSKLIKHPNVELKAFAKTPDELISYMKKATIYMQLSYHESFGIAQIEAMLYSCIPVSNPGGAIPEVVGDAGFLIKDYNTNEYLKIIREILDGRHEHIRSKARNRVITRFSLEARREKLFSVLKEFGL